MAKKEKAAAEAAETPVADDKKGKKGGKGKKEKTPQEGKKKRKIKLKLILIGLLVLAVLGLGVGFFLDQFHIRTFTLDQLSKIGPEGKTYTAVLQQRELAVGHKEAELTQLQAELQQQADKQKSEETRLAKLKNDLDARDAALTEVEISTTPIFRGQLTAEKLTELKNLGKIYSNMSADAAAEILPQLYSAADMASIIFYMDKTAAANLLAALTPELSAQITTEILRE